MAVSKDLVAASATSIVLSILSEGQSYGYAIIKRVRELSDGQVQWTDGMLYPVLHRLESQGMIKSKWILSDNGRRRKYYRINRKGTLVLNNQKSQWMCVNSVLQKLWENKPCLT